MNIDKSEIENFDNYAHEWWNKRGPYKFIHLLTPLRLKYISNNLKLKSQKKSKKSKKQKSSMQGTP